MLTLQYIRIAFAAALQLTGAIKRFEGGPFVVVVNKVRGNSLVKGRSLKISEQPTKRAFRSAHKWSDG